MLRHTCAGLLIAIPLCAFQAQPPPDFANERAKANQLFTDGRALEALPLYEDLAKRDPSNPAFAERHAAGLIAKAGTLTDSAQEMSLLREAYSELLRARSLGDNSNYANTEIDYLKALLNPAASGKGAPAGYHQPADPKVIASMQAAEAAFAQHDYTKALAEYGAAAAGDPAYYEAALFAGDTAFRMHDVAKAGEWFQKAIAIDLNRETAYRYWGDALLEAHQPDEALERFADSIVAEPYARTSWIGLQQWSQRTGRPLHPPPPRPEPCREMHTLKTLLACAQTQDADPAMKRIKERGFLEAWALLSAPDQRIAQEYAGYRAQHRTQLRDYILDIIAGR